MKVIINKHWSPPVKYYEEHLKKKKKPILIYSCFHVKCMGIYLFIFVKMKHKHDYLVNGRKMTLI